MAHPLLNVLKRQNAQNQRWASPVQRFTRCLANFILLAPLDAKPTQDCRVLYPQDRGISICSDCLGASGLPLASVPIPKVDATVASKDGCLSFAIYGACLAVHAAPACDDSVSRADDRRQRSVPVRRCRGIGEENCRRAFSSAAVRAGIFDGDFLR